MTATALRSNLFRVLERIRISGQPVEFDLHGTRFRIVPETGFPEFCSLKARHDVIQGDPDSLVHLDWSDSWKP